MILTERIFALRALFPFSQLRPEELLIIATAVTERTLAPGQVLARKGGTLGRLFIRVDGDLVNDAGVTLHPVVGTTVLLTGCEVPYTVAAGPKGYHGLCLARGKFLTVVNECPALLVGFFQMPLVGVDRPRVPLAAP